MLKKIVIVLSVGVLSGCSAFSTWYGETKPMMTFAELPSKSTLFVWSPKNSAAFVNAEGKACVQGAEVFHEKSGSVDVSNELLGILKGVQLSSESSSDEKAIAISLANDIISLKTNSERTTYLSIGMFGLCQLQANGGITPAELLTLVSELIASSLKVGVKVPLEIVPEKTSNKQSQPDA